MHRTALRRTTTLVLALAAAVAVSAPAATADPVTQLQSGGAKYAVYLVKDLGGGAYYNVTTGGLYALSTGSDVVVGTVGSGADLLATLASNGRDLLLVLNGKVLVPLTGSLP